MTNEEVEELIKEMSEEIDRLSAEPEKELSREAGTRQLMLQLKSGVLRQIKAAQEQKVKAGVDYVLLCKYGEKNPFLMNFIKSQTGWYGF